MAVNDTDKVKYIAIVFLFLCSTVLAEDRWASQEVNVRTGPGTNYDVMGRLFVNEKVEVFSVTNGWAQILFENVEGYVSESLLLFERIKTPEEEEAARIAAEMERQRQERERKKARNIHIIIIIVGIIGTIIIIRYHFG